MALFNVVVVTVVLQVVVTKWEFDFLLAIDAFTYLLQFLFRDEVEGVPSVPILHIALILDFLLYDLLNFVTALSTTNLTGSRGDYWRSFEIDLPYHTADVVRSLGLLQEWWRKISI